MTLFVEHMIILGFVIAFFGYLIKKLDDDI